MNALFAWSLSQGANALNLAAGVIVAHFASPYEFARFATLSATLAIMSAVLNPMINEIAQRVALHRAIELSALRMRTLCAFGACLIIGGCACRSIVLNGFEAVMVYGLIPISLVGHSWATASFYGLNRMISSGAVQCIGSALKVGILLGLLSQGLTLGGIGFSYFASFLITIVTARFLFKGQTVMALEEAWVINWRLIIGLFLLSLPFSLDQPIVHARLPDISADYAALMTYSKTVMLLASPALALVFSSSLQKSRSVQHRTTIRQPRPLVIATVLTSILAFTLWTTYPLLFPLLLGKQYYHVTPYLTLSLLSLCLCVLSHFVIQGILLSCRWSFCLMLSVPPVLQTWLLFSLRQPSISNLVTISVTTFFLQFLIGIIAMYSSHGNNS